MKIIADVDTGTDDALALYYLARAVHAGEARLLGVGTVHGNTTIDHATKNTLAVLELLGIEVPVAPGAATSLAGQLHTAEVIHGANGLGGIDLPTSGRPSSQGAVEQLLHWSRRYPGELTVVATGPLTNIGLALKVDPSLASRLKRLVVMGGTCVEPGNVSAVAEANFFHDPEAADIVITSGAPVTLIGLDVTHQVYLEPGDMPPGNEDAAVARFSRSILRFGCEAIHRLGQPPRFVLHDPLAAAVLFDPGLVTSERFTVHVETTGSHTRGMLVCDRRPGREPAANQGVQVALGVDRERFLADFLQLLTWQP